MHIHVKFFAIFREMAGLKTDSLDIEEGTTVEALWKRYAERAPRLANIRAAFAVNQRLVKPDAVLHDGDEVGFLPPVSGGAQKANKPQKTQRKTPKKKTSTRAAAKNVAMTTKPIDLNALMRYVEFPGAGAILTFTGVVRDNAHGKRVGHLEYEAYPEMAETSMRDIIGEIAQRWPEARVAMAHRTGKLKIGEASLVIAVAAPHRPEAYAASRYAIERVKAILPVWKKEFSSDGDYWVEGPVAGELPPEKAAQIVREAEQANG